jgi:hypothetical protein
MSFSFSFDLSGCVALAALALSGYSTWKTFQFNRKQEALIKSQALLTELQSKRELAEAADSQRADLGAAFVKLGSNQHRLKVFNQGKATARHVEIDFPEGNQFVLSSDVTSKFPLETLDRYQSVQLIAAVHMGSPSKTVVRLRWEDGDGEKRTKVLHPTL